MFDTIINPGDGTIAPPPTTTQLTLLPMLLFQMAFRLISEVLLSTTLTHIVTLQNTGTVDATGLVVSN